MDIGSLIAALLLGLICGAIGRALVPERRVHPHGRPEVVARLDRPRSARCPARLLDLHRSARHRGRRQVRLGRHDRGDHRSRHRRGRHVDADQAFRPNRLTKPFPRSAAPVPVGRFVALLALDHPIGCGAGTLSNRNAEGPCSDNERHRVGCRLPIPCPAWIKRPQVGGVANWEPTRSLQEWRWQCAVRKEPFVADPIRVSGPVSGTEQDAHLRDRQVRAAEPGSRRRRPSAAPTC